MFAAQRQLLQGFALQATGITGLVVLEQSRKLTGKRRNALHSGKSARFDSVAEEGLERSAQSSEIIAVSEASAAKCATVADVDADLSELIQIWDQLPKATRKRIMGLVRSA